MYVRVTPEELSAAAQGMSGDGPTLRVLARLLSDAGSCGSAAAGQPSLSAACQALGDRGSMTIATLAEACDTLAAGLGTASALYADAEDRLAVMGRRILG